MPDLICLGKALTGGFPLSACVGRADIMDAAWPPSRGEAIHTSTFQGHPVGCAMALAQIAEIRSGKLPERARAHWANFCLTSLRAAISVRRKCRNSRARFDGRGRIEKPRRLARHGCGRSPHQGNVARGFILLPEGEHGNVISFTPPLTITRAELAAAVQALGESLT